MNTQSLTIAVVGHTNTGKTSLMRTLLRDPDFGEVSDQPGVTRTVDGASLLIDGEPAVHLFDTPGLEDSITLLDLLEQRQEDRTTPPVEVVSEVLKPGQLPPSMAHEAAVLRQVLASDLVLYVVDARQRVLSKHRDELEILRRCARPVVPVLNFIAYEDARLDEWHEALAGTGIHAIAEFDTVVFDASDEIALFEKWRSLLNESRDVINALIESRKADRRRLLDDSLGIIADLLIDAAAFVSIVPAREAREGGEGVREFCDVVRARERECAAKLLRLHRFSPDLWKGIDLPVDDGRWGLDLFSPEALRQFGVRTSTAAGAGALAGLAVDALLGGLSFGAATATGAAIGATWSTAASHGRRLIDRARGRSELRCSLPTLQLLEARALELLIALLARGHASEQTIEMTTPKSDAGAPGDRACFARARAHPEWSALNRPGRAAVDSPSRQGLRERFIEVLRPHVASRTASMPERE